MQYQVKIKITFFSVLWDREYCHDNIYLHFTHIEPQLLVNTCLFDQILIRMGNIILPSGLTTKCVFIMQGTWPLASHIYCNCLRMSLWRQCQESERGFLWKNDLNTGISWSPPSCRTHTKCDFCRSFSLFFLRIYMLNTKGEGKTKKWEKRESGLETETGRGTERADWLENERDWN